MPEGGVAADDVAGLAILFRLGFSVKLLREVANPLLHHDVDMAHAADPRPPIFGLEHLEDEVGALGVPVAASAEAVAKASFMTSAAAKTAFAAARTELRAAWAVSAAANMV